jgi:hypothetical protein
MWPGYRGDPDLPGDQPDQPTQYLNWETPIKWDSDDDEYMAIIQPLFLPAAERFYNRKEIDTRKLNYEYYRIDIRLAAAKSNRFKPNRSLDVLDPASTSRPSIIMA